MTDPVARLNAALEGRYAIERELGEGGMATVYLASDLKHERKVALKVLKPELAAVVGAERFLAEIKTTANLQHPHILPLHDSGDANGFLFYVMPYVEGETLKERIDREKQLPVDEAMGIATAVANALQAAHDQGIVHRDIKPGNILLSRGEPLVADFGIALAVGAAGGGRLTETGLSVGTPYYMSPEQATGDQVVGPPTDTYALACVLYEMLVGEPPFLGNTAQAVLGKIIQGLPVSATAVRKAVPANVDAAIRKALEKLPADRFTGVQEFAKALADPGFRYGEEAAGPERTSRRWRQVAIGMSAVAGVALIVAARSFMMDSVASAGPVMRQNILPVAAGMARPVGTFTALAPDGSSMVYAVPNDGDQGWQLWLKPRDAAEATLLPGTEGAQNLVYSPNGEWIVFAVGTELRKRPIGDGSTITLAEGLSLAGPTSMIAIAWLDDGTILYELPQSTLMRIPDVGGEADTVAAFGAAGFAQLSYAGALPGSRGALVTLCITGCVGSVALAVVDFEADTTRILLDEVVRGWYTSTGHLMYVRRDGAVFAAPFDLDALELTGPGIPLFDNVSVSVTSPQLVVASDGTLLYAEGPGTANSRELVWVDRAGRAEPLALGPGFYTHLALSPDDDRVAITMGGTDDTGAPQLWVKELPDGPMGRLTTESGGSTRRPVWSPDGRSISYIADFDGTVHARTILADGSSAGAFEVLLQRERVVEEVFFTPDGRGLLFREGAAGVDADIGFWDLETDSIDSTLLASEFRERAMSLSPDGRWMAYTSDASGRDEVFVRPFPGARTRVQVSTNGGTNPVWAHNGREIFFIDGDGWLTVAPFQSDSTFTVGGRQQLFDATLYYESNRSWRRFDIANDDERFLMMGRVGASGEGTAADLKFIYVQNFFEELRQRVRG